MLPVYAQWGFTAFFASHLLLTLMLDCQALPIGNSFPEGLKSLIKVRCCYVATCTMCTMDGNDNVESGSSIHAHPAHARWGIAGEVMNTRVGPVHRRVSGWKGSRRMLFNSSSRLPSSAQPVRVVEAVVSAF